MDFGEKSGFVAYVIFVLYVECEWRTLLRLSKQTLYEYNLVFGSNSTRSCFKNLSRSAWFVSNGVFVQMEISSIRAGPFFVYSQSSVPVYTCER